LVQGSVWPVGVVVIDVLVEDEPQMPFTSDQHLVQALAANAADPVGLDYWIWPGRLAALGSSLSDLLGRLPARALPAWLPDGAGPA
jgi:hypothetical protein